MATKRDLVWLALIDKREGKYTVDEIQEKAEKIGTKQVSKDTVRSVLVVLVGWQKCAHDQGSKYYHIRL